MMNTVFDLTSKAGRHGLGPLMETLGSLAGWLTVAASQPEYFSVGPEFNVGAADPGRVTGRQAKRTKSV
jgi:hypothetical protein